MKIPKLKYEDLIASKKQDVKPSFLQYVFFSLSKANEDKWLLLSLSDAFVLG